MPDHLIANGLDLGHEAEIEQLKAELEAFKQRKSRRRPRVDRLIAQAEKAGKSVASITTPDGITVTFGESKPTEASNPWLADLNKVTKQ
jgi:hypothetical protein